MYNFLDEKKQLDELENYIIRLISPTLSRDFSSDKKTFNEIKDFMSTGENPSMF